MKIFYAFANGRKFCQMDNEELNNDPRVRGSFIIPFVPMRYQSASRQMSSRITIPQPVTLPVIPSYSPALHWEYIGTQTNPAMGATDEVHPATFIAHDTEAWRRSYTYSDANHASGYDTAYTDTIQTNFQQTNFQNMGQNSVNYGHNGMKNFSVAEVIAYRKRRITPATRKGICFGL
jgi:hypothetical protein